MNVPPLEELDRIAVERVLVRTVSAFLVHWVETRKSQGIRSTTSLSPNGGSTTPSSCPETREAYRRLLAQGWTDSLRHLHRDEVVYTFWDYMWSALSRNAGLRIDHLLVSPELVSRLEAAAVDSDIRATEKTSEHAPTWVIIE